MKAEAWSGAFSLDEGATAFIAIGPFELWATRLPNEWRLAWAGTSGELESRFAREIPSGRNYPDEGLTVQRCGFRSPPKELELIPALADRPLVICPEDPFVLAPREEVRLYVSTPMWVRVRTRDADTDLLDKPTHRPTDTWFGPSTLEGELCYAVRTKARLNLENVPVRPHRAISVVEVSNQAKTVLEIEKVRLPNLHMSVYVTPGGHYWTERVTIERRENGEEASIRFGRGAPDEAVGATLAGPPRSPENRSLLVRAFSGLLR